jgi:hypothetical protein
MAVSDLLKVVFFALMNIFSVVLIVSVRVACLVAGSWVGRQSPLHMLGRHLHTAHTHAFHTN